MKPLNPTQHDLIIELQAESEKLKAECARLLAALKGLYDHDADYITVNHLGPVNHNQCMRDAFDVLREYSHTRGLPL